MVNPIVFSVRFLKEVREEMKKVSWLSSNEVVNYTVLVLFISIIIGAYLGVLDLAFQRGVDLLLDIDLDDSSSIELPVGEGEPLPTDPVSDGENAGSDENGDENEDEEIPDEQAGSEESTNTQNENSEPENSDDTNN